MLLPKFRPDNQPHSNPRPLFSGRWLGVMFLILSLLVPTGLSSEPVAAQNFDNHSATTSQKTSLSPIELHQQKELDAAKVPVVSFSQEWEGRQSGLKADEVGRGEKQASSSTLAETLTQLKAIKANPQVYPHVGGSVPTFFKTYYANVLTDTTNIATDCSTQANTDCTLRSAITATNTDGHGSNPDLVVLKTTAPGYSGLASDLPQVADYTYLSSTTDLSCSTNLAGILGNNSSVNALLTLGNHDYVNGIFLSMSPNRGVQINGSNNTLTCMFIVSSGGSAVAVVGTSAANNQIGGISPTTNFLNLGYNNTDLVLQSNGMGVLISGSGTMSNTVKNTVVTGSGNIGVSFDNSTTFNSLQASQIITNNGYGVKIGGGSNQNRIGGNSLTDAAQYNIVTGNGTLYPANPLSGVYLTDNGTASNTISDNYIGTDTNYSTVKGNGQAGVRLDNNANSNIISGNVLSGNRNYGLLVNSANNTVTNNMVGTDATGLNAVANVLDGIVLANTNGATTGNSVTNNVVGGNGRSGILISGQVSNNTIQSNRVGVAADLSKPLYNGTSTSPDNNNMTCNPGSGVDLSQDCNGIFLAGTSASTSPSSNQIISNTVAANDTYAQNVSGGVPNGPAGIELDFANGSTVQGNNIGVAVTNGSSYVPLATNVGIWLLNGSSNNQIGGDLSLNQGNLIANAVFDSIQVDANPFNGTSQTQPPSYGSMNGNKFQGNALGVDFNGNDNVNLRPINGLNGVYGIEVEAYAVATTFSNNLIGVDVSASTPNLNQANLIGNHTIGVLLARTVNGTPNSGNVIAGNKLGVNRAATTSPAGNEFGIKLSNNVAGTLIQGNYIGAANVGNNYTTEGIQFGGAVVGTNVTQNFIGSNAAGADLHNTYGILFTADGASVGAGQNVVSQNVIEGNTQDGIKLGNDNNDGATITRNTFTQNSILNNGGLGINLNYAMGTPTGILGGSDSGPNNQAASPVISSAYTSANSLNVYGTANPNSTVEIFKGDGSSPPQGASYMTNGTANAAGFFFITIPSNGTSPSGFVVATSTLNDAAFPARVGSTSQFSSARFILPQSNVQVTFNVSVPNYTPSGDTIYLTGNPGTPGQGTPDPQTIKLIKASSNSWSGTFSIAEGTQLSYKYTRGSFNTVEKNADGSDPAYRPLIIAANGINGTQSIFDTVGGWRDPMITGGPFTLSFAGQVGSGVTASQSVAIVSYRTDISANATSNISYSSNGSGWLNFSPASFALPNGFNQSTSINLSANVSGLASGTYTAVLTYVNSYNTSQVVTINITLNVSAQAPTATPPAPTPTPGPTSYTYNLPLLANDANTAVGHTTTFVTFQNLATNSQAHITVQYYGLTNGAAGPSDSLTLPAKGQKAILPNIGTGTSYGGIITSDQPLNVVVSESLSSGGSAYTVTGLTNSTLYSPLALNGAFGGFVTNIIIFNAGSSASSGQIQFYDETGTQAASQTFQVSSHSSQLLSQAGVSGLSSNHSYWAKISATNAGDSLTAQVIEFGPANFVATFNASVPTQAATTLYAPAVFNGQFGFVTGMGFANPNNSATIVNIKYFDAGGNQLTSPAAITIPANGNSSLFQGTTATPTNVTSAVVTSNQPIIMTVNERGPSNVSGTYVGIVSGSSNVALPVMANGFAGFVTGATVLNVGTGTATLTLTYLDGSGNTVGNVQNQTLPPNASFLVYQGATNQGLSSNYFGTALITSDQPLLVTTNALNTAGLFYTYTEPSK